MQPDATEIAFQTQERARRAFLEGRYDEARTILSGLLRDNPDNAEVLVGLGVLDIADGNPAAGLDRLATALESTPDEVSLPLILSGMILQDQLAVSDLEQLLQKFPNSTSMLLTFYILALQSGEEGAAEEWFQRLMEIAPVFSGARINRAVAFSLRDDLACALKELDAAVRVDPESRQAYTARGLTRLAADDMDGALEDFHQVISLAPALSMGYLGCGDVYFRLGDLPLSIEMYHKALERDPDNMGGLFGLAVAHASRGEYPQALEYCDHMIELQPDNVIGFAQRGDVYLAMEEYDRALADFARLRELAPHDASGYRAAGDAYRRMGGHTKQALDMYRQALERNPEDPDACHGMGLVYEELEDYEKALEQYLRVTQLAPQSFVGFANTANMLRALDRDADAIEAYEHSLALNPNDASTHLALGLAYQDQGLAKEALAHLDRSVALAPDWVAGYVNRAAVRVAGDDYQGAESDYLKIVELQPDSSLGYRLLGELYRLQGIGDSAIQWYHKALERDADDGDAHWGLGAVYEQQGQVDRALDHYERVVALEPEDAAGYVGRGSVYLTQENYDSALANFDRAAECDAESGQVYWGRGRVYELQQRWALARDDYTRLISCEPANPDAYSARGRVYMNLEQLDLARQDLDRALALDPDNLVARFDRGWLRESQSDFLGALHDYSKLVHLQPNEPSGYVRRGVVFGALEAYDYAVHELNAAAEYGPENAEILVLKADYLRLWAVELDEPDKLTEAETTARRALAASSDESDAYPVLGATLAALNRWDEAIAAFDKASEGDPGNFWVQMEKGKVLIRAKRSADAWGHFRSLGGLPHEDPVRIAVGQALALRQLDRHAEANRVLNRSSEAAERTADYHTRLGNAFAEFEYWEDAVGAFRDAIACEPDNAPALNELAWCQAEKLGHNLEECTRFAARAVELAAEQHLAFCLDTLGWIWFRRDDLQQARRFIQQAHDLNELDQQIRQHLQIVTRTMPP